VVRPELGIEVAQNSDADAVAHVSDCTRGAAVDYARVSYARVRSMVREY
jgi:hypothetical protein